ncbi:ABC transporter substrate-binding protein [Jiella sonneratiae]|uniref:ABC transporter substrate-binding protein n=1 Tax=Jiella sonneratiae TaxID=2816856 RepID=A0ABS3J1I9_9HYPH|nr:ABC transporter substrate-binding protein [Jiella sonneratiae]MBO0902843.1 ABC transporter substrate-binding protein [Jiella sonneratiae]
MNDTAFRLSRRRVLEMCAGAGLAAALRPGLALAQSAKDLPKLSYPVNIVNTGSNATLVLQKLLENLNYLDEFNVETKTINVQDGSKLIGSLLSGGNDICLLSGFSQVLPAIEKGATLKLVAGANILIAQALYTSNPDVKSVKDLRGKTIGTGAPGALLHEMMVALLRKHGVDPSEVQFVNIGSSGAVFKSVAAGRVDAGPAMTDVYDQQEKYGVRAIADFWSELPDYPYQGSYASEQAIADKRDGLVRVLAAYCKMYRFMMDDPKAPEAFMDAYRSIIRTGDEDQGEMMIRFTREKKTYARDLMLTPKQIDYMQDLNLELGIQKERLAFDKVADMSLAKDAVALVEGRA